MICSSPPRYAYARMRRSSSITFPSLKLGLFAVAWTGGKAGACANPAEMASSENNGTASAIATDPHSRRVRIFLGRGIIMVDPYLPPHGSILKWEDRRRISFGAPRPAQTKVEVILS